MSFREIQDDDIDTVVDLLAEGFPRRRSSFWRRGLENMRALPAIPSFPRYGYLLEEDGAAQGLILQLTTRIGDEPPRANVACWYVRQPYRSKAPILYKLVSDQDGGLLTNLSPAANVVPIARAFGYRPYTSGVCLLDLRAALRPAAGWQLELYRPGSAHSIPPALSDAAQRHHRYGCHVLYLRNGDSAGELLIYRVKWIKGALPCAQFIFGHPDSVLAASGVIMRHLLARAIPLALVDIGDDAPSAGARRYQGRNLRYAKGGTPAIGDLLDSEFAVFGP